MGEIKAGQIDKGMFLLEKGEPFLVVERDFVKPGKGSAFCRLKLKNARTGAVLKPTHKTQDIVEEIEVTEVSAQYLYKDDQNFVFMNAETFDQFEVPISAHENCAYFAREGETYRLLRWEDETLQIKLPPKIDLEVIEASEGVKGDTATNPTKMVTLEGGLEVRVPIFIKQGEVIRVSTETQLYEERVNK